MLIQSEPAGLPLYPIGSVLLAGAITLGWMIYLRFLLPLAEPRMLFAWTASAISLSLPCWFKLRRLENATEKPHLPGKKLILSEA